MANFLCVLLFVVFPPPELVLAQPGVMPDVFTQPEPSQDACKADAARVMFGARAKYPGAKTLTACLTLPAPDKPDPKTVKPGLQPDGNVLNKDGTITSPRGPV